MGQPPVYSTAIHLREATPYIRAYGHKKMIVLLNSPSFEDAHLENIAQDLALLYSLNVQPLVIVNPQRLVAEHLQDHGLSSDKLTLVQAACNKVLNDLMAKLSVGLVNSTVTTTNIPAVTGNFVVAKPKGILDGEDLQHLGIIRKVKHRSITDLLERHFIVMMTTLGFSPSGETYYVDPYELVLQLARNLEIEKVVILGEDLFEHPNGEIMREWRPSLEIPPETLTPYQMQLVEFSIQALMSGMQRVHLLKACEPGAIIQEIFTRDGCGTMATLESYEQIRVAVPDDASGLFELIQPLEDDGILVKRPREQIEAELAHFTVVERDHAVIGCCALYPYSEGFAELACFVIAKKYRSRKQGDALLDHMVRKATNSGVTKLFVLTTQTADWFIERGFKPAKLEDLPIEKQSLYNMQRNSKIFIRTLQD